MGKRNQSSGSLATTSFAANPTQTRITQNSSLFTGEIDTKVTHWFFFWLQERTHTWKSLNLQGISKLFREHVQLCGSNNVIFLWSCKTSVKCSQGHYQKVQFFLQQLESRYLCHTVYSLQSVNMVCIQIENLRTPIQECWGVSWTWPMSWGTYQGERSSSCTKCVSWNAWNLCNRTYYNTEIAMQVLLVLSM